MPALFISHGAPNLSMEDFPAKHFFAELGSTLDSPRAVLVISAHFHSETVCILSSEKPDTVHDFYGFAPELHAMRYPAKGDKPLALDIQSLFQQSGMDVVLNERRGMDHGAWVPLSIIYPKADIPVVQVSINTHLPPEYHYQLGQILKPLRQSGVLILGSGGASHNLGELHLNSITPPTWACEFIDWLHHNMLAKNIDALLDYRRRAPNAIRNHPTEEHLLPLFTVLGAMELDEQVERIHHSYIYGTLSMDAYRISA